MKMVAVMEEMSFGRRQHRAILWTKDGHKRCCFRSGGGGPGAGGHHGHGDSFHSKPKTSMMWDQVREHTSIIP